MATLAELKTMNPEARGQLLGASFKGAGKELAEAIKAEPDVWESLGKGAKRQLTMEINGTKGGRQVGTRISRKPANDLSPKQVAKNYLTGLDVGDLSAFLATFEEAFLNDLGKALPRVKEARKALEAKRRELEEIETKAAQLRLELGL